MLSWLWQMEFLVSRLKFQMETELEFGTPSIVFDTVARTRNVFGVPSDKMRTSGLLPSFFSQSLSGPNMTSISRQKSVIAFCPHKLPALLRLWHNKSKMRLFQGCLVCRCFRRLWSGLGMLAHQILCTSL